MTVGYAFAPRFKVFNSGSYGDEVDASLTIRDSAGTQIYADNQTLGPLNAGDSAAIAFTV